MSLFWQSFLGTASALGLTGVLAYLLRTSIQHWLAKSLAEHAANLETQETGKRATIARLDRERAELAATLTKELVSFHRALGKAPSMASEEGCDPARIYMNQWHELGRHLREICFAVESREYLLDDAFRSAVHEWRTEMDGILFKFLNDIFAACQSPGFWNSRDAQIEALYPTFDNMIKTQQHKVANLKAACRRFAGT
jgi:hypothetical protein